jgi:hypothetical protein
MDLEALENIDDFVGGAASLLGWHTLSSRPHQNTHQLTESEWS